LANLSPASIAIPVTTSNWQVKLWWEIKQLAGKTLVENF